MSLEEQQKAKQGVLLAIGAYTMWGIAPIYFKALSEVSPLEILSHRVIWSFFLLTALLHFGRRWRSVRDVFRSKKKDGLFDHNRFARRCELADFYLGGKCKPHA
jgi:chloramphenicol-sensitive protein RarD